MHSLTNHMKAPVAFVLVLTVVLVGTAYAAIRSIRSTEVPNTLNRNSSMKVSEVKSASASGQIAQEYKNVSDLVTNSQLIVIGQFEGDPRIVPPNLPPNGKEPYDPGRRELSFRVTGTLKGELKTSVNVAQRVGFPTTDLTTVVGLDDDTLFKAGDSYILFLNKTLHEREFGEFYWIAGAVQGAMKVIDSKVYSRNVIGDIPADLGPSVSGQPLDAFLANVRDIVSSR